MLNDYKSTAQNKSRINDNQYSIHSYLSMILKDHKCYSMFDLNSRPD